MTLTKMDVDILSSIVMDFFDPSSEKNRSTLGNNNYNKTSGLPNSIDRLDCQVSALVFGNLLTSIASTGFAYRILGKSSFTKCL